MRFSIILAAIPVATIGAGYALTPAAPVARAIEPEGYTARRIDDDTFRARWRAVAEMPPTTETVYEPLLLVADAEPRRTIRVVRLARPIGVCARHGMRKVHYGRSWRCRR